jgi:hypothetical protein
MGVSSQESRVGNRCSEAGSWSGFVAALALKFDSWIHIEAISLGRSYDRVDSAHEVIKDVYRSVWGQLRRLQIETAWDLFHVRVGEERGSREEAGGSEAHPRCSMPHFGMRSPEPY